MRRSMERSLCCLRRATLLVTGMARHGGTLDAVEDQLRRRGYMLHIQPLQQRNGPLIWRSRATPHATEAGGAPDVVERRPRGLRRDAASPVVRQQPVHDFNPWRTVNEAKAAKADHLPAIQNMNSPVTDSKRRSGFEMGPHNAQGTLPRNDHAFAQILAYV